MAHPFYGDYKKANYDVNKSLDNYIQQAARLMSNERIVTKQQKEANNRLKMELDSVEKRFDRTEDRLDTALADAMKSSSVDRKVKLATNARAAELHPIEVKAAKLDLKYDQETYDYRVDEQKYSSLKIKDEYLDGQADDLMGTFIDANESLFSQEGLFDENGQLFSDDKLDKMFKVYNEDQIDDKWADFQAENPEAAKRIGKQGFVNKWEAMELRRTEGNWENIGRELEAYGQREGLEPGEIIDQMEKDHGRKDWWDDFEAMLAANPDSEYTKYRDFDGNDFADSKEGQKVTANFENAIAKGEIDYLKYDEVNMYDNLRESYSHNEAQKALNSISKAFLNTDEEIGGSISVNSNGVFVFKETDTMDTDVWYGELAEDGKVYWKQSSATNTGTVGQIATLTGNVLETNHMLEHTEGLDTAASNWKHNSTIKYESRK